MNRTAFSRLFWKEYRLLRGFWLAIALLAVALEVVLFFLARFPANEISPEAFYGVALCLPIFYGLGCGAVLFAGEYETETYDFQRSLPIPGPHLARGKFSFALISTLLLPVLLLGVAWLAAGRMLPTGGIANPWLWVLLAVGVSIGVSIELLAWSTFFSLLLGRVLWATVLATGCVSFVSFIAVPSMDFFVVWVRLGDAARGPFAFSLHVVVTLSVLAVDLWLARRWLREYPLPWSRPRVAAGQDVRERAPRRYGVRMAAWSRLIWHAWLQGRWTLAIILMTFTCVAALPIVVDAFLISEGSRLFRVPLLLTPLVAAVIGASMFWFDQRGRQYRFFTDHGVSPRRLWFSRHVVAAAAVVFWCALALLCLAGEVLGPSRIVEYVAANEQAGVLGQYVLREEAIHLLLGTVGLGVVCYGVGQLCSLCVRSGVIALFLGLVLSWLAGAWAMMMWEYHVPLWFSVAPIPVYLLWAGWLRAPDWLAERTGWRARVKLAAAIIVPFVAISIAVVSFRVCEIPVERYEFGSQAVRDPRAMTPRMREGTDTALMYAEALHCFLAAETRETTGSDSDPASPDTSSPQDASPPDVGDLRARGLQLFLEAARREECRFPDSWSPPADDPELSKAQNQSLQDVAGHATQLAQYVLATCDALEDEGQVTEAVDRYLSVLAFARHLYARADWFRQFRADAVEAMVLQRLADWAALESQTAATLRSALGQLEREHFSFTPERRYGIVADYWSYRKLLDAQHSAAHKVTANEAFTVWFFSRFLPWEHARAKRLLEVNAQAATENLEQMQTNVQAGLAVGETDFRQRSRNASMANWIETTPGFVRRNWTIGGADIGDRVAMWATTRRIVRLQLMLAVWRKDRGSLPQTLDEVLDGRTESFGEDPFTGVAFRYEPAGFGLPLPRAPLYPGSPGATDSSDQTIPPDTPFLWSAGPLLTYSPYTNSRPASASHPGGYTHVDYIFRAGSDSMPHPVTSERELWERGLCFPVP